jgi:hypothetical protein
MSDCGKSRERSQIEILLPTFSDISLYTFEKSRGLSEFLHTAGSGHICSRLALYRGHVCRRWHADILSKPHVHISVVQMEKGGH